MLWQRVLTAAVGIPLLLALIYLGGWWLAAGVLLLSLVGLQEFFRLAEAAGLQPKRAIGYGAATLVMAAVIRIRMPFVDYLLVLLLALTVMVALVQQMVRAAEHGAIANAGTVVLGVWYLPFLLSYLVRLRCQFTIHVPVPGTHLSLPSGVFWLTTVVAAAWAGDTTAYAVGKAIGRHKLCPKISPGKTVEGAIAGLLATTLVAAAMGWWLGLPIGYWIVLGLALAVAGQLGDLSKSVMKRQAGVKDSGTIIPGHGGVLDRFDSLLFSAPVAFYYLATLGGYYPR